MRPCATQGHLGPNDPNDTSQDVDHLGEGRFALLTPGGLIAQIPNGGPEHQGGKDEYESGTEHRAGDGRHEGQVGELQRHGGDDRQESHGDLILEGVSTVLLRDFEDVKDTVAGADEEEGVPEGGGFEREREG